MNKVSFEVFLGTYNAAPWIAGVINSLEQQTCEPFVVNIIDNSSTDNTVEIIEDLFSKYKMRNTYKLVQNSSNIGAISTFLDRLDLFEQDWIFMVHQDDFYHPDHFETLIEGISKASASTSLVFTAMKRMDENNNEIFSTPSIASKLSESDRLGNLLLTLQINPVNFPGCALRKTVLASVETTRHTTAFNDTEMLLRMMCVSDVKYIPKETMHYRIHAGNASAITNNFANSHAVLIGLIELFHSQEFTNLIRSLVSEENSDHFFQSLNEALAIRLIDDQTRNLAQGILAERLVRVLGYQNKAASSFLIQAQSNLGLLNEAKIVQNLAQNFHFNLRDLRVNDPATKNFKALDPLNINDPKSHLVKFVNNSSLNLREAIFDKLLRSPISLVMKRPFARVWRKTKKSS